MSNGSVKVRFAWNKNKLTSLDMNTQQGLVMMGYDVANQAKRNAPYETGNLRNSIRAVRVPTGGVDIIAGGNFGGKSVPYAKRREYENKKNPQTKFYMKRALNTVLQSNWQQKYFGGITK